MINNVQSMMASSLFLGRGLSVFDSCESNLLKTYALAGLVLLVTELSLGNVNSFFAQTTMDTDIIIAIDTSENFGDEAEMLNNVLNVFTAAFVATDGNLEVVVMNRNTICISAPPDSGDRSSDENLARYRHMRTDVESKEARVTIRSAYDE